MSNAKRTTDADVVIVGAGPTGAAMAILLAQYGRKVVIVERHLDTYPLPRAVHLDSEVFRILHQLGIGEGFAQISRLTRGLQLVDARHRVLARFERELDESTGLPEANLFDQPELERLLRKRLHELDGVTLLSGHEVTGVATTVDGVSVRVRAADGEERVLGAAYVIGCDGANSLVRGVIGSRQTRLGFEQRWLVVDVRTDVELDNWDGVHQVCDPRRAATYMRIGPDRHRFELQLLEGETPDDFAGMARLRRLIAPWIGVARDDELQVIRATEYTFRALVAERWRSGRAFIAGDAAHLTPPFIGQGMCAGLRDAMNLAWKLDAVLDGRADEALLGTYELERKPHATGLIRLAVMLGHAMTGGGSGAAVVRRGALTLLRNVPAVADRALNAVTPPLRGPLVLRRLAGPARGTLLPLVRLGVEGEFVDRRLGPGLGVVALAGTELPETNWPVARVDVRPGASACGERQLARWLASHGARWALLRPDRTVLALGSDGARLSEALAVLTGGGRLG